MLEEMEVYVFDAFSGDPDDYLIYDYCIVDVCLLGCGDCSAKSWGLVWVALRLVRSGSIDVPFAYRENRHAHSEFKYVAGEKIFTI